MLVIDELAEFGVGEVEEDAAIVSGWGAAELGGEFGVDRVGDGGDGGDVEGTGRVAAGEAEMEENRARYSPGAAFRTTVVGAA